MKCKVCNKEIQYNENETCEECHQEILRRLEQKERIFEELKFNVKGVTFENEDGKDIQKEIRKIFLEYEKNGAFEKYSGYTNTEIKEFVGEVAEFEDAIVKMQLKEDIYEGKPCVKVYIKKYDGSYCHIGYIPKEMIKQYLRLKEQFKKTKEHIELIGGKIKQLEYDDETDREKVVVVELTYGFEVNLIFYNDEEKYQQIVEKKKQKAIEEWETMKRQDKERREQEEKERQEEIKRINRKVNIQIGIAITIMSIPFIWILWKIISFVKWFIEI